MAPTSHFQDNFAKFTTCFPETADFLQGKLEWLGTLHNPDEGNN